MGLLKGGGLRKAFSRKPSAFESFYANKIEEMYKEEKRYNPGTIKLNIIAPKVLAKWTRQSGGDLEKLKDRIAEEERWLYKTQNLAGANACRNTLQMLKEYQGRQGSQ